MGKAFQILVIVLVAGLYLAVPLLTIRGWVRWSHSQRSTFSSIMSLVGFTFSTSSVLLEVSSAVYAYSIHGFQYYDPLLLRIYRAGGALSLLGLLFSSLGMGRTGALRWAAPFCSAGSLLFWFFSALSE
jgi:hypothetical protein